MKTVVFDMDGTLVQYGGPFQSSWDAIGAAAGLKGEWDRLLAYYFPKKDLYWEWVRANARTLRGVSFDLVRERVLPPPYTPGAPEAIAHLTKRYKVGILTSGVDFIAEYIRHDLNMHFAVANKLGVSDGHFTGEVAEEVFLWSKDAVLRDLCQRNGWLLQDACFVGDHVNDIPAMKISGYAIAFAPKDAELAHAAAVVTHDFRQIPTLIADWERRAVGA